MGEPSDDDERRRLAIAAWLASANGDVAAARVLVDHDGGGVEASAVAFFAEQAVEKAVKALLLHERVTFPPTHDIGMLRGLLPDAARTVIDERAVDIGTYATGPRYPASRVDPMDLSQSIGWGEAREALAVAESVVAAVGARLGAAAASAQDDPLAGE